AGFGVSGYDRTPSRLTAQLEKEGIEIHYEDRPDLIPLNVENTFVIYTPAIPLDLGEFRYVKENGYIMWKRAKALGEIARGKCCLAISGTHGKTTTSTLLAHILQQQEDGCTAFLGGISKNYHSNLLLSRGNALVAEADEFDRSFLHLFPEIAVITSTDADHLDIYGDHAHVKEAFHKFGSQVKSYLIVKDTVDFNPEGIKARILRYSYDKESDFYASDIKAVEGGKFDFTLNYTLKNGTHRSIEHCVVGIPGWVNIENAVAASAVALLYGINPEKVRRALASFEGVERRMDVHANSAKGIYIDDYAHHPKELASAISSIRAAFPGRRLTAVFQPHLFTRTRDFADEFAASLSMLDSLIMLPIYPARELPIVGVNAEMILDKVTIADKRLVEKSELMDTIKEMKPECLITFGAGDIDRFIPTIEEYYKSL
ncbi:MAG: UDP-N-acetylmuramate--L-alanine ligase, partial [Bacteroidales bacterium]|nr:UDP-N-acetylmuramate--L-alanine ligase [Bacteroidales bacterium]